MKMTTQSVVLLFLLASLTAGGAAQTESVSATGVSGVFNVREFGAKGDGRTLDTSAIASAIAAAAKAGGGTVLFPAGTYRSGTFELRSNITLQLEAGAVIQGSKQLEDYDSIESHGLGHHYGVDSSGEGTRVGIIFGRNLENVGIIGPGTIDGSGDEFFDFSKAHFSLDFDPASTRQGSKSEAALSQIADGPVAFKPEGRPGTMIACFDCRNILMRDVTLSNSPNWTVHLQNAEHAIISGVRILNDPLIPNNDGFDCFGCKDVHFSDCDIHTGDDDFAIVNSRGIAVDNCSLNSRSSGIRLEATEYSTFSDLNIYSNRGIAVYERGAGKTEHVSFSNIVIETQLYGGHWWGKGEPIYVASAEPSMPGVGEVQGLLFSNITGEAESSIILYGNPEAPLREITLSNVHFTLRTTRKDVSDTVGGNFDLRWTATDRSQAVFRHDIPGLYARNVEGIRMDDISFKWRGDNSGFFTSAMQIEDFRDLEINGFEGRQAPGSSAPVISLARGNGVSIRNSKADTGSNAFVFISNVSGERLFLGNDIAKARSPFSGEASAFHMHGNYLPSKRETIRRPVHE